MNSPVLKKGRVTLICPDRGNPEVRSLTKRFIRDAGGFGEFRLSIDRVISGMRLPHVGIEIQNSPDAGTRLFVQPDFEDRHFLCHVFSDGPVGSRLSKKDLFLLLSSSRKVKAGVYEAPHKPTFPKRAAAKRATRKTVRRNRRIKSLAKAWYDLFLRTRSLRRLVETRDFAGLTRYFAAHS